VSRIVEAQVRATDPDVRAAAFRAMADRHMDGAYRLARVILHDPADAQDAAHDAWVQAWRKWGSLRDPDRFEPWFNRILVNTCRDRLRRQARRPTQDLSGEIAAWAKGPDPMTEVDTRDLLRRGLAHLSPDHQLVVALRFYRDLTADQIAEQLGIRVGTVHSRLHYALKQLHAVLSEPGAKGPNR